MNHYEVPEHKRRLRYCATMRKDVLVDLQDYCQVHDLKYSRFIEELVMEELEKRSVFKYQ